MCPLTKLTLTSTKDGYFILQYWYQLHGENLATMSPGRTGDDGVHDGYCRQNDIV
jgi:hypothetical protein